MEKLLDLGAVYVECSTMDTQNVRFIILDEQGEEILALSLDYALSITEATLAFMEWEEKLSKRNMH